MSLKSKKYLRPRPIPRCSHLWFHKCPPKFIFSLPHLVRVSNAVLLRCSSAIIIVSRGKKRAKNVAIEVTAEKCSLDTWAAKEREEYNAPPGGRTCVTKNTRDGKCH